MVSKPPAGAARPVCSNAPPSARMLWRSVDAETSRSPARAGIPSVRRIRAASRWGTPSARWTGSPIVARVRARSTDAASSSSGLATSTESSEEGTVSAGAVWAERTADVARRPRCPFRTSVVPRTRALLKPALTPAGGSRPARAARQGLVPGRATASYHAFADRLAGSPPASCCRDPHPLRRHGRVPPPGSIRGPRQASGAVLRCASQRPGAHRRPLRRHDDHEAEDQSTGEHA